jgi:hypothetical protein
MPSARHIATAQSSLVDFRVQIIDQSPHCGGICYKVGGPGVEFGFQDGHESQSYKLHFYILD